MYFKALFLSSLLLIMSNAALATTATDTIDPAWTKRAEWYYAKKQFPQAAHIYATLAQKHPQAYFPYLRLAHSYRRMGHYEDAIRFFSMAKKINPALPHADFWVAHCYEMVGMACLQRGYAPEAIRYFCKGTVAEPGYWKNYYWIGRILLYQDYPQYAEAAIWLKKACDKNPYYFKPRMDLGICYLKLGRREPARIQLEECMRLNPSSVSAHFNLGLIYAQTKQWAKAWREFHLAVTMGESKEAFSPRTA